MGGTAVTVLGFCLGGHLLMLLLWFQNEQKKYNFMLDTLFESHPLD